MFRLGSMSRIVDDLEVEIATRTSVIFFTMPIKYHLAFEEATMQTRQAKEEKEEKKKKTEPRQWLHTTHRLMGRVKGASFERSGSHTSMSHSHK